MSTFRALLPALIVATVVGVGLGALGAFVPGAGWGLVVVFGGSGVLIMALDALDTYRRNRSTEEETPR